MKVGPARHREIVLLRDAGIAFHVRRSMIGMKHFDAAQSRIAQLANKNLFGLTIPETKANGMRQDWQTSAVDHSLDGIGDIGREPLHITRRRFAQVTPERFIEALRVTLLDQHAGEMWTASQGSS